MNHLAQSGASPHAMLEPAEELHRLAPGDGLAAYNLAAILFHLGRTIEVPLLIDIALTAGGIDDQTLWLGAIAAANLSRRDDAVAAVDRLVALSPQHPLAAAFRAFLTRPDTRLPDDLAQFFKE